jgi:IS30 family transposase
MKGVLMARRGRKRRLELEAAYWELLQSGVGAIAACAAVGIGRKTGYRWRAENGGLPPAQIAEAQRSGRYLSLLERQRIATLHSQGVGVRAIAQRLGRSPSTVSRELRRNTFGHDRGVYDGDLAHARTRQRARRPRRSRLLIDEQLRAEVQAKLLLEWSPEQIAGHLRAEFPDRPSWHLCHETIYQALYQGDKGLNRRLTARLRTGRPLRRRRRRPDERRTRYVTPALLIHHRPPAADARTRIGDWEGDLITGRLNKSAIGTLVDRTSRSVRLIHLPTDHGAEAVCESLIHVLSTIPAVARLTLTWDQGSEMALHEQIAAYFGEGVYFAEPGSPWQRPTNENTNGLLRQYFPKGTDLRVHTAADLLAVEDRVNNRPRKIHGWRTPAQVFLAGLAP